MSGDEELREAARRESALVYGTTCPEFVSLRRSEELRRAIAPRRAPRRKPVPVTRIEQALARGHLPMRIAKDLHVTVADVAQVAARMDKVAAK